MGFSKRRIDKEKNHGELEEIHEDYHNGDCIILKSNYTAKKQEQVIEKYRNSDKIKIMVGNIIPMGTGHNITKANVVVVNSPDWAFTEHSQAEDRVYRIGQTEDVYVHYLLFEETVEEFVFDTSEEKKENSEKFYGK